ncbi:MAG: electron transfer flavoprotein subunit alpha/FixB family protein [Bryobacterales bacterium]|nr:electron transfer flavoprotein subunit alpha/FixB family protein [Bryobacterales bacterium]
MILTFVEHDRGALSPLSLQMLACARQVSQETGEPVHAVLVEGEAAGLVESLSRHGVSRAYQVRHAALEQYAPAAWARSLSQILDVHQPSLVLAAATDRGNEVMAWVAAMAGAPLAANCVEVRNGAATVVRHRWGGSLLEEASVHGQTRMLTVAPFAFEAAEVDNPAIPVIETFTPTLDQKDLRVRVTAREESPAQGVNLQTARVVIGGGRGVGSAEGFGLLEQLAAVLGGAVGGSRVATNNGWRPHSVQVGLTGNRIAPDIYIACGISGAIQHLVGCKSAKNILVINKDPEAPFFRRATYGVVGDLHEVIPALIAEINARKRTR